MDLDSYTALDTAVLKRSGGLSEACRDGFGEYRLMIDAGRQCLWLHVPLAELTSLVRWRWSPRGAGGIRDASPLVEGKDQPARAAHAPGIDDDPLLSAAR